MTILHATPRRASLLIQIFCLLNIPTIVAAQQQQAAAAAATSAAAASNKNHHHHRNARRGYVKGYNHQEHKKQQQGSNSINIPGDKDEEEDDEMMFDEIESKVDTSIIKKPTGRVGRKLGGTKWKVADLYQSSANPNLPATENKEYTRGGQAAIWYQNNGGKGKKGRSKGTKGTKGTTTTTTSDEGGGDVGGVVCGFLEAPDPGNIATGVPFTWYRGDVRCGNPASPNSSIQYRTQGCGARPPFAIYNLDGFGGTLESGATIGIGGTTSAGLVSTAWAEGDATTVGFPLDGPLVMDVLPSLTLSYRFHKQSVPSSRTPTNNRFPNIFAAVKIALEIFNPVCNDPASSADCYFQLIFEPYWQGMPFSPNSGGAVTEDQWFQANIDANTGGDFTDTTGWWATGGFGTPNSFGGGANSNASLNTWLATLSNDFPGATILSVQIGMGTFNAGQLGWFDDVRINYAGLESEIVYDFEVCSCEDQ